MHYYFSSPLDRIKILEECNVTKYLLSFANEKKHMLEFPKKHETTHMMIDSGAFTVWNSGREPINVEEYKDFMLTLPQEWTFINLDVIPQTGSTQQEIQKCIDEGFENFLYLKSFVPNVIPVHHYGESNEVLKRYLEHTDYIGISPANDTHETVKRRYLTQIFDYVGSSVKTHGLGYSSLDNWVK
jgi:hypothetical protein